jgi:hypothetical protein
MKAIISILLFCAIGIGAFSLLSYNSDRQASEAALRQITGANLADRDGLEQSFARAKAKALAIRSDELRDRTLAEITKVFLEDKKKFDEADRLKTEAMALMLHAQDDMASLNDARAKAEELLNKIQTPKEAAALRARLDELFESQRKTIEERIAAEERRRAEELARQDEAERLAQEERAKTAEREREAEREQAAAAAYARQQPKETSDCCCKMKFDTGLIFTHYEWEYKRFDRKKCADPGFWDNHKEGWCVPDSYCN